MTPLNPNIARVNRPHSTLGRPEVEDAILRVNTEVDRFFQFNGPRPVYVSVIWRGRYYAVRARYVVENSGGQHMTIASAYTN